MANIGAKNVYKIFAGGNHSWVIIDDIVPVRKKYRPPSPVPDNKQMQLHGDKGLRKSQTFSGENKQMKTFDKYKQNLRATENVMRMYFEVKEIKVI